MSTAKLIMVMLGVVCLSNTAVLAQKKKQKQDTLAPYRELAYINEWYKSGPVQFQVKYVQDVLPAGPGQNAVSSDLLLYYEKNNFYMEAEGLEQIVNDSLVIQVNNETQMIRLYSNDSVMQKKLKQPAAMYMPGTSLSALAERYRAGITDEHQAVKTITLQSRENIYGTSLPKETISISYQPGSFQPVASEQFKRSLVLIEAATYNQLMGDENYRSRLVKATGTQGDLFFLVKEVHSACTFTMVNRTAGQPPVRQEDRIVKNADGAYQPAKGFESYVISNEL